MSKTRLQLRKVEFVEDHENNKYQATVLLKLGLTDYIGQYEADRSESPLRVIALATFQGVNDALLNSINLSLKITLRVAEEMKPAYMTKSLFVVIVDVVAGTFSFKPTGAVVAESHEVHRATAAAALDSLNRLIQHLLRINNFL